MTPADTEEKTGKRTGTLAVVGALALLALTKLKLVGTLLLPALKFLKLGKIATTMGASWLDDVCQPARSRPEDAVGRLT
jgi:hypothetical protein